MARQCENRKEKETLMPGHYGKPMAKKKTATKAKKKKMPKSFMMKKKK